LQIKELPERMLYSTFLNFTGNKRTSIKVFFHDNFLKVISFIIYF